MTSRKGRTNINIHWREERSLEELLRKKRLEFLERQHQEYQELAEEVERRMEDYEEVINSQWNQRLKELREHLEKVTKQNVVLKKENLRLSQEIIQAREDHLTTVFCDMREEKQA